MNNLQIKIMGEGEWWRQLTSFNSPKRPNNFHFGETKFVFNQAAWFILTIKQHDFLSKSSILNFAELVYLTILRMRTLCISLWAKEISSVNDVLSENMKYNVMTILFDSTLAIKRKKRLLVGINLWMKNGGWISYFNTSHSIIYSKYSDTQHIITYLWWHKQNYVSARWLHPSSKYLSTSEWVEGKWCWWKKVKALGDDEFHKNKQYSD